MSNSAGDRDGSSLGGADQLDTAGLHGAGDLGLFALLWVPYALLVYRFWFLSDDAYISFRYARNWAAGHGLRYNLGDHIPVEGYSNFLWVVVCTVMQYIEAEVTFWAPLLAFACGTAFLYLVFHVLRQRMGLSRWPASIAVLFLGCSPAFAVWSSSGLETMPFALLLFVTFERLILRQEGPAPVAAGLAGLAMALMRVEGVYWAVLLAVLLVYSQIAAKRKPWRVLVVYIAIVGVGYAVYFACRYSYYQLPFSNSVYVKVGMSVAVLERGFDYLAVQVLTLLTPFMIIPGAAVALRRKRRSVGIPVAAIALAVVVFSVVVSGDFMAFGRLLVPGLVFNTILFAWLLQDGWGPSKTREVVTVGAGLAIVVIGLLPAADVHLVSQSVRKAFHFRLNMGKLYRSELAQWRFEKENAEQWGDIGRTLRGYARPGDSYVAGAIGTVGYYSDLFIYDGFGLVTRKVAARTVEGPLRMSPGHDKAVSDMFFLEDNPTLLMVGNVAGRSPEEVARGVGRAAMMLRRSGMDQQYVVDFTPLLSGQAVDGELRYIALWRRIEQGIDPTVAWADLAARLDALVRGSSSELSEN